MRELGLDCKGRATSAAARRSVATGNVNAAVEAGEHELHVVLGSGGELLSEGNEPRAVRRLAKRLAEVGCVRVLIEGGSYQSVLIVALRAADLPVVIVNPRGCRKFRVRSHTMTTG